ncbi:MAG: hypothetical protein MI810_10875 [Flavobacteriales bacterium]|nr:hypothetical protein [Flavobacteriales bacterium]
MIGQDFEKISFELFGLDLLEPMALITDSVLGLLSIYFAFRLRKIQSAHPFFIYWRWFFIIFGLATFSGGLGHALFNYWGVAGKFPSWILAPISLYALEQGMVSVYPNKKKVSFLKSISFWKYVVVVGIFVAICVSIDLPANEKKPFLPLAINSALSMVVVGGFMAYYYQKKLDKNYLFILYGSLILLPSAFIFLLKINLHPWFNKEDASHVLMMITLFYYYLGVKKISRNFKESQD